MKRLLLVAPLLALSLLPAAAQDDPEVLDGPEVLGGPDELVVAVEGLPRGEAVGLFVVRDAGSAAGRTVDLVFVAETAAGWVVAEAVGVPAVGALAGAEAGDAVPVGGGE